MVDSFNDKFIKSINRSAEICTNYDFSYDIFNDLEESCKSLGTINRSDVNSMNEHADFILFNSCMLSIIHYIRERGLIEDLCQYLKSLC